MRKQCYWDFNCTLQPADHTGPPTPSKALEEFIHGLALKDTWEQDPKRPAYTHYAPTGATRLDRIYLSKANSNRKTGIEILRTAFTDHHAVVLRLTTPPHEARKTRCRWKMDPILAQDDAIRSKLKREWEQWRKHKRFYPDVAEWWERHIKTHLRHFIRRQEVERNKNHNSMENHLYECLYDILLGEAPENEKYNTLQRYKAKIVNLPSRKRTKILLDTHAKDKMEEDDPSLYHVVQR